MTEVDVRLGKGHFHQYDDFFDLRPVEWDTQRPPCCGQPNKMVGLPHNSGYSLLKEVQGPYRPRLLRFDSFAPLCTVVAANGREMSKLKGRCREIGRGES